MVFSRRLKPYMRTPFVSRRIGSLLRRARSQRAGARHVYYEEEPGRRIGGQAIKSRRSAADRVQIPK